MVEGLLLLSGLIWLPVLFYGVSRQAFTLILVWLLVAPVALRVFDKPGANPFFETESKKPVVNVQPGQKIGGYLSSNEASIKLKELLEPTRLLFGLFFIVFVGNAVVKRRRLGPFDATEKFAFIFSLILIASALFQSKRTAYSLRVACDAFLIPFIAYFAARRLITSEDQLQQLVRVIGYVGLYLIGIGLVERSTRSGFTRVTGPFEDRNEIFIVMAVVFFVMLVDVICRARSADKGEALPRVVQQFVVFFSPVIILFGWSRGNILGLLSGLWVLLFLGRRLLKPRPIMTMAGLALLIVPILGLGFYELTPQEVIDSRISRPSTVYARIGAWQNMIEEMAKTPIFGIGFNNLRDVLEEKRTSFAGVKSETHAHNTPLSILAELGLLGFLVFALLIASMVRTGLSLYRTGPNLRECWQGIAIISIITAYLVGSLFANSLYISSVSHVYVYLFVGGVSGLYAKSRMVSAVSVRATDRRWPAADYPAGV